MTGIHRESPATSRRHLLGLGLGFGAAVVTGLGQFGFAAAQESNSYTFLVLGLDTRTPQEPENTDVMMVARVNLDTNTVRTLSIPRDLYVEIPGFEANKINRAYDFGIKADPELKWQSGATSAKATIEHNFGLALDGVVITDMTMFPRIVDAVGGVDVVNPYAVADPTWPAATFAEGPLHLDGAQAIIFVRTRKMDGDGGRVMRQQLVLAALLAKIQDPAILSQVPDLVQTLGETVRTDIPLDIQVELISVLPNISQESLAFTNIEELLSGGTLDSGMWVYQADWNTLPGYVQSWLDGTVE